jgi:hypothetical protein
MNVSHGLATVLSQAAHSYWFIVCAVRFRHDSVALRLGCMCRPAFEHLVTGVTGKRTPEL